MAVKTEPNYLGDGIKWEEADNYSRRKITVASGNTVSMLEVVGKVSATGKFVPLNTAAADGSENATGIMVADVDASAADKEGVIIESDALVVMDNLVWPDGISAGDKTAAIAQLEALGIKAVGQA